MKERLLEFLAYLGISQRKFEENVGLSNGFVDKVGDSIRVKNLEKISSVYPELNINWLKTGDGEKTKNSQQTGTISNAIVGANVSGNGNKITNNDIAGMIELQKGYQDMIKKSQEQIDRLIGIIESTKYVN